ncbi:MAG: TetR/AcrR family transcriptional regulator [Hyphococcus sp.]
MSPRSEIETGKALDEIKELFWRQGYEDASIEDVVRATGFNRYALYNAFGGKREIFLAALDAYYLERKTVFLSNLDDPDCAPLDAVRRVFEFAISEMAERGTGCLICNVATQVGQMDPTVGERIESYLAEIESAYTDALSRAQARGELNPRISPGEGAQLLIAVKLGLGVHAKSGANGEDMLRVFNATMAVITQKNLQ